MDCSPLAIRSSASHDSNEYHPIRRINGSRVSVQMRQAAAQHWLDGRWTGREANASQPVDSVAQLVSVSSVQDQASKQAAGKPISTQTRRPPAHHRPQTTKPADQSRADVCREASRALSCFSSSPPPDSTPLSLSSLDLITPVQWSVEYPPTSICLTSLSHLPLSPLRDLAPASSNLSPGRRFILTTHHLTSSPHLVRPCLPPWS